MKVPLPAGVGGPVLPKAGTPDSYAGPRPDGGSPAGEGSGPAAQLKALLTSLLPELRWSHYRMPHGTIDPYRRHGLVTIINHSHPHRRYYCMLHGAASMVTSCSIVATTGIVRLYYTMPMLYRRDYRHSLMIALRRGPRAACATVGLDSHLPMYKV